MRLNHLALKAFHINDCNVPRIGTDDLLLVCSGSGETKTILELVKVASEHEAQVALVTSRSTSSMADLADVKVLLPAQAKITHSKMVSSIQPMTSLMEQTCLLFLDILVLVLMDEMQQHHDLLKSRHSILE